MRRPRLLTFRSDNGPRAPERGNALVELAMCLSLLLMILLGIVDFGRVFYAAMALTQAARSGAQYGAQSVGKSSDFSGMEAAATSAAQADWGTITAVGTRTCTCSDDSIVSCTTGVCATDPGNSPRIRVQVTATKTFQTIVNYPGIPHVIPLSRTAIMRAQ